MNIIYGVVYYLLVTLITIVGSLSVFVFRPARRLIFNWASRTSIIRQINLFSNLPFAILVLVIFVTIDSVLGYLDNRVQTTEIVFLYALNEPISILSSLRKLNKFYIAERNLILTFSCLIMAYILRKIVLTIAYLNDLETYIEAQQQTKK